jgi:hypothetical protein
MESRSVEGNWERKVRAYKNRERECKNDKFEALKRARKGSARERESASA